MAEFKAKMPDEIIKYLEKLEKDTEKMVGDMTTQASEIVAKNIRSNIDGVFNDTTEILEHLRITKVYENDKGAIGNRVAFYGYLPFKNGRKSFTRKGGSGKTYKTTDGVPVEFIVNVAEYGSSKQRSRPFVRKSFVKSEIKDSMLKTQEKWLPKDE